MGLRLSSTPLSVFLPVCWILGFSFSVFLIAGVRAMLVGLRSDDFSSSLRITDIRFDEVIRGMSTIFPRLEVVVELIRGVAVVGLGSGAFSGTSFFGAIFGADTASEGFGLGVVVTGFGFVVLGSGDFLVSVGLLENKK